MQFTLLKLIKYFNTIIEFSVAENEISESYQIFESAESTILIHFML